MCSRTTEHAGKEQTSEVLKYLHHLIKQKTPTKQPITQTSNALQRRKSQDGVQRSLDNAPLSAERNKGFGPLKQTEKSTQTYGHRKSQDGVQRSLDIAPLSAERNKGFGPQTEKSTQTLDIARLSAERNKGFRTLKHTEKSTETYGRRKIQDVEIQQYEATPLVQGCHKTLDAHMRPINEYSKNPPPVQGPQAPTNGAQKSDEESFMLWIHCNYCFEPYIKRRRPAYLLSCHHILCAFCLEIVAPAHANVTSSGDSCKCKICNEVVRMRQIGNNMPEHLKVLFHPQPWEASVSPEQIVSFQAPHRAQLESAIPAFRAELQREKEKTAESRQKYKELLEKQRNLKIEMVTLAQQVRRISLERMQEKVKLDQDAMSVIDLTPDSSMQGATSAAERYREFFEPQIVSNRPDIIPFSSFAKNDFTL